ncbi:MAG: AsmA family protein [Acidobacteriota bacterium]
MTGDPQSEIAERPRSRRKLWTALLIVAVVLVLIFVPPYISISRYKGRITELISAALERPVRLSSVELRILPRPGFVITDFSVAEDPAFGAQPVLHADSVVAAIRIWPLWRGRLQISRISVDDASLNLVHTPDGRWNIEDLFHTAASHRGPAGGSAVPFPYMEATNSRINVNNGLEKLPFSLLDADASLWRESGGTWRVRLRGQPARTDVSLDLADTGIVRVDATLHPASALEQMPLHVDLDWRQAELGQLSRLLLGSDQGWRGDLTGELHLDGTVASAKVKTRLRASSVHRSEFAPAAPLDFDATCSFKFLAANRSLQDLACDSPIGDGRIHVAGNVMLSGATPDLSIAADRVPAQAGLDLLRTVRNDLDPGLQAAGVVSGQLKYQSSAVPAPQPARGRKARPTPASSGPLTGSLTVQGLRISGGPLNHAVHVEKLILEPNDSAPPALAATVPIRAGASAPLILDLRIALHGFEVAAHGPASLPRLRELALAAGFSQVNMLAQIAGDPATVNMTAEGPWLPSILPAGTANGSMSGTIALKEANWRTQFLAGPVLLPSATLHFENGAMNWEPVNFTFGPVKGTAQVELPADCDPNTACPAHFALHFANLDAAALQAALLGAHERGTLLVALLARFRSSAPNWPPLEGSLAADALELGPVTLHNVAADLQIGPAGAQATSIDANLLGGQLAASADVKMGDKPAYKIDGTFEHLNPAEVGVLAGMRWTGGAISGTGHVELAGYTGAELASSAVGTLHFTWNRGSVASAAKSAMPAALLKFDTWNADAQIGHGDLTLGKNQVVRGKQAVSVGGSVELASPAVAKFAAGAPAKGGTR